MSKKLAIIATKGTLDWAYPPFILASTAAALGYEVEIFFTFYGLNLLEKDLNLKVSSLGNPGMPMPIPMPVFIQVLPGMQSFITSMMKKKLADKGVIPLEELRALCLESGVKFYACQMTVDLFERDINTFLDEVTYAGATAFLDFAGESDISLYI
ncbi:MAG: DsrE/DsrF/DrsH-like family protein [gamma proteobacterium symbiont of Taylorina sp.]|nr:DsrE/DsrF/DrsH-like family protein [gamma proteobacterium symbiont of Taylorina sp.]